MLLLLSFTAADEHKKLRTLSPYIFINNGDPSVDKMPLKETRTEVTINGVIADVKIVQHYKNEGPRLINAKYIFLASTRAAVHGMKMIIQDKAIQAKFKKKKRLNRYLKELKKREK